MKNDPLMFVESINLINEGAENQNIYDSRKEVKDIIHHRIDDINAMLMYNIDIICKIKLLDNNIYEGIPKKISGEKMELFINNKPCFFNLNSIIDISIRKKSNY